MGERKPLSNKLRFEVFKRDCFTCQYCGRKAPDVVLNVDHITPVSKGGTNDIFNLITSCFECNNGKRDVPLNKKAELDKQREEIEILHERKNQIDMMMRWKKEVADMKGYEVSKIMDYVEEEFGISINENGKVSLQKYIKKFGFSEVLESANIAFSQYSDAETAFSYIPRICATRKEQVEHPEYKDIYYLSKIAQAHCTYYDKQRIVKFLKRYYEVDDFETLKTAFSNIRNWSNLLDFLANYYGAKDT